MNASVVDTNVVVIGNFDPADSSLSVSLECVSHCVNALREVRNGRIVLDDKSRILNEYRNNVRPDRQLPGGEFLIWLHNVQYDPRICERVSLTPKTPSPGEAFNENDFEEFPTDEALADFDWPDRKFVAVAIKSHHTPEVLHAADKKSWIDYRDALVRRGLQIRCLCPEDM